jgi:uncharacterized protein YcaQ
MLFHLHMMGEVMVVGHDGNQNVWGLSEEFLPKWVERRILSEEEFERQAALRAIRALGTATPREIWYYFVRGRYENLEKTLRALEEESAILRVRVEGFGPRDERYIHENDLPLLETLNTDEWQPRMSFLPPFDNLLVGRDRLNKLFGFDYVREQFFPKEKRKYGTYVLPILWGSDIIGRLDPEMDRQNEKLLVNSVHAEPGAPGDRLVASKIGETIERLAEFLGAKQVVYTSRMPQAWKGFLR